MSAGLTIEVRPRDNIAPPSRVSVVGQNVLIGRTKDAQISLESNTISRRHAEMVCDPFGRWWIRDLGSRNGTHVNGSRIVEQIVRPGDLIQVGDFALSLSLAEDSRDKTPAVMPSTVDVSVVDDHSNRVRSLSDLETPRLSATHLSTLSDFGQQLLAMPDSAARLKAMCELMVSPAFHGRSALVLRASKESLTEPPKPLCTPSSGKGYENWSPYISRSLLRTLLARNDAVLASNTGSGSRAGPAAPDPTPNMGELSISSEVMAISALACPIKSEPAYTDLLYVILPPEFGTSEWLALSALVVKQFQQAEQTWSAKKLGEAHAAIERELSRAHAIQERLVPRNVTIPNLDFAIGFIPCRWVGGDYVDVIVGKNGKVLLTVADVCGKGLPAALVASSLHMFTHTAIRAGAPLQEMMQNLNTYLAESLTEGSFVTMLAALLDPATGQLETVNAGHPAGFFVNSAGEVTLTQQCANMPLGLDPASQLDVETTTLNPGEVLLMFTDGLTELPLANGELLGEDALGERFAALVKTHVNAPANLLSQELSTMLDSLQDGMAKDDRTFLVARRT